MSFSRPFKKDQNSGLGLTITKELIQQLGHGIALKVEDDQFILTLSWEVTTA